MHINNKFHSKNYASRIKKIEYIILHYTEMNFDDALSKLMDPNSEVSSHYLIKNDGEIFELVSTNKISWHAGESSWKNSIKLNQNSIGIEMDNPGNLEFSSNQMLSCINLCNYLVKKYKIDRANIIGHSDIAPDRKIDPGIFFNWELLGKNNLGIWHNIIYKKEISDKILFQFGEENSKILELQKKLHNIGYKIELSGKFDIQTNYVVRAFQSHFCPEIIKNKGGIDFYQKLSSIYSWDMFSDIALNKLLQISL